MHKNVKILYFLYCFGLGCTSELPKSQKNQCERNNNECKICTADKCNSKSMFEQCFHCDSTRDVSCADGPGELYSKICTAYDDQCYTHIDDFNITRGCLKELNYQIRSKCRNNNQRKCTTCKTEKGFGCNNKKIKMEFCAQCNSKNNESCRDNAELFQNKICSEFNIFGLTHHREGCYMHEVCDGILN